MPHSLLLRDRWDLGQPDLGVNSGSAVTFTLYDLGQVTPPL